MPNDMSPLQLVLHASVIVQVVMALLLVASVVDPAGGATLQASAPIAIRERNRDAEPNGESASATPATSSGSIAGGVDAASDALDLYRVELRESGELRAQLAAPDFGAQLRVALLDASGTTLAEAPVTQGLALATSRVGAGYASAVSSGTAALHLALRAVGVTEGDEVITSPFSFVASANVIVYERARPVFVDIDPRTLNLDVDAAAAAMTSRTSAFLPVHIFGYPADVPALERHGLPIVEDACEALGAVHADGVPVGGRGHPAAFGFYANKQLTTGEGGMLTLGSAEHKARVDSERNQGRAPDMGWLDHDRLGFNYRLVEGSTGSRSSAGEGSRKGTRQVNAERPCPICNFRTDPPHDARRHRGQDDKRPFTAEELRHLGLKRV